MRTERMERDVQDRYKETKDKEMNIYGRLDRTEQELISLKG